MTRFVTLDFPEPPPPIRRRYGALLPPMLRRPIGVIARDRGGGAVSEASGPGLPGSRRCHGRHRGDGTGTDRPDAT
jgi:hypothetical protein